MKKNTLFAIVAMLMMSVSALAQSNSYNMVIEMANGTKINIGPNDVKNIYFNDGELVVSGENIEKLVQTTNENLKQTTKEMSDLNARIATIETMIDKLSNQSDVVSSDEIKKLQAQIDYLADALKKTQDGSANAKDIEALAARLTNLEAQSGGVSSYEIKKLQAQIYDLAEALKKTQDGSANAKDIEALAARLTNLEAQSGGVSINEIKKLQAQIYDLAEALRKTQDGSANAKDIEALAARLTNLEAQSGGVSINEIKNLQAQIDMLAYILQKNGLE